MAEPKAWPVTTMPPSDPGRPGPGETGGMDPERWRRIETLFHDALERPDAEREPFLRDACGDDDALFEEVRSLIAAGDHSGRIGGVLAEGLAAVRTEDSNGPGRIGPYRVLEAIGHGGLGTVYLAERDDEHYSMRVAIKLVRRGYDTAEILDRLRRERQILARLEHPNITRLLDGGSTDDGQPYLVMEHVDGLALEAYADRHRLTVRRRLELLLDVCSAVAFAHRNLVIHRDLKPSNVMVTEDGTVKLLDFGIAKLMDRDGENDLTLPEQRLLTLDYASPEQLQGLPLTTATDLYSLGATLYRLLCGRAPFEHRRSTPPDVLPKRPSERAFTGDASASALRGTTPRGLRQALRGDLDNIVLKAMAPAPKDRYGTAAELADDLRRHLDDRPVRARPQGLIPRGWKLLRRNRLATAAAALTVVSLLVGLTATAWQARKATRAQLAAERVSGFLGELLEASKPEVARGEPVPVRSVLDRGAERIASELVDEPEVQTVLMTTMGKAYFSLGLYQQAADLHRGALAIREARLGVDDPAVAESANDLAGPLIFLDRLDEAEELLVRALDIRRRHLDPRHPSIAESLNYLGVVLRRQRRLDEAERVLSEAHDLYLHHFGPRHTETAGVLNNLALVYYFEERFQEAEALLQQAVSTRKELLGLSHPETLTSQGNLARVLRLQGRLEESRALFQGLLEEQRRLLGDRHREVANTWNVLAKILADQDELTAAAGHYRQALGIYAEALGPDHTSVGKVATSLGEVLAWDGRRRDAEAAFDRALGVHQKHDEHPELARTLEALGTLLCRDRPDEAVEHLRRATEIRRRLHPEGSTSAWRVADAESRLGACLQDHGDAGATALLERAHSL
ncbi:MAG: serine/threonine-protein kinase, partial [Acidobacteriota bacterium]